MLVWPGNELPYKNLKVVGRNGLCGDKSRHFDPYALMEQEIKELAKRNINIGMQTQKCIVIFEKKKY